MDALLKLVLALVLCACTELKPGDDRLDGALADVLDACADPPIGECPPVCLRPRVVIGRELGGVGNVVSSSATWGCDLLWALEGDTYVDNDAVITIAPGTLIEADPGAALIFGDGARLEAVGTRDAPIVFRPRVSYEPGDEWRGLYLLGDARVLDGDGDATTRDLDPLNVQRTTYGGNTADYDCGTLSFVRLEFAGRTSDGGEAEALFVGGCGTQTTFDHVQVHESADDGVVIFGGGFDMRHMIVTGADRDALQWERGWRGTLQYYVAHMPVASEHAALQAEGPVAGDTPPSAGVVGNMTMVATSTDVASIVEGSSLYIGNSVAIVREHVMRVRPDHVSRWRVDDIEVHNSVLFTEMLPHFEQSSLDVLYAPPGGDNSGLAPMLDPSGTDPVLRASPSWRPMPGSPPTMTHGDLPAGLEPTDFAGAIDPDPAAEDWTEGWTFYLTRI